MRPATSRWSCSSDVGPWATRSTATWRAGLLQTFMRSFTSLDAFSSTSISSHHSPQSSPGWSELFLGGSVRTVQGYPRLFSTCCCSIWLWNLFESTRGWKQLLPSDWGFSSRILSELSGTSSWEECHPSVWQEGQHLHLPLVHPEGVQLPPEKTAKRTRWLVSWRDVWPRWPAPVEGQVWALPADSPGESSHPVASGFELTTSASATPASSCLAWTARRSLRRWPSSSHDRRRKWSSSRPISVCFGGFCWKEIDRFIYI